MTARSKIPQRRRSANAKTYEERIADAEYGPSSILGQAITRHETYGVECDAGHVTAGMVHRERRASAPRFGWSEL